MSIYLIVGITASHSNTQERRVALVIGNSEYLTIGALKNATHDAIDMTAELHKLGFDVVYGTNQTKKQMSEKIRIFDEKLKAGNPENTIGLFYYAGHGLEVDGTNYLVPVNAQMDYQEDAKDEGIALNRITRRMTYSKNRLNIVILDACRDNPLPRFERSALSGGWGGITEVASGMFIAYGTSPGEKAIDSTGNDRNGVFTKQILANLNTKGLTLEQVFKKTRAGVLLDTNGKQTTWQNNATTGDFYFNPINKLSILQKKPQDNTNSVVNKRTIRPGETFVDCQMCPEMIAIPAGDFSMGQNKTNAYNNPQHDVEIKQFNLSISEVTVKQYKAFVDETNYQPSSKFSQGCHVYTDKWLEPKDANWKKPYYQQTDDSPVVCVNWNDANEYVKWLKKKTKRPYRLPSESEWEYAAKGGTNTVYSWGDNVSCELASYGLSECNISQPQLVKSFSANQFGLYDMHGNVSEWVMDCWHRSYENAPINGSAWVSDCTDSYKRISRGGTWVLPAQDMNPINRSRGNKDLRISDLGFRVAQD